MLDLDLCNDCH
jgi:hypothetical protein